MKHINLIVHRDALRGYCISIEYLLNKLGQSICSPNGGMVAHDLLDHMHGIERIGELSDELEALGAIWFIRGEHEDRQGNVSYADLSNLVAIIISESITGKKDLTLGISLIGVHDEDIHDDFAHVSTESIDSCDRLKLLPQGDKGLFADIVEKAVNHMLMGYYFAEKRYETREIARKLIASFEREFIAVEQQGLCQIGQKMVLSYDNVANDPAKTRVVLA